MSNLPRILIIYAIAIPLALILGYSMSAFGSDPDLISIGLVGLVLFVLALPIILHSYLPILLFCWNATLVAFFLPGAPSFFLVVAFASFLLLIVQRGMSSARGLFSTSSVRWPLIVLMLVVFLTAAARGGIGIRALGSNLANGKKYIELLAAVAAFFVLSNEQIPRKRAMWYASLFFLGGITPVLGDLIYVAGPKFYWLYNVFSSAQASTLAGSVAVASLGVFRIEGTAAAGVALCSFMLARYGIKGILDPRRPWRLPILIIAIVVTMLGGYRARLFAVGLFIFIQFFLEGLWRTWIMPVVLTMTVVVAGFVLAFSTRMPEAVQRSISFLPVKVDPGVAVDAEATVQWRKDMWAELVPQIPDYLLIGKGYGFSESEYYITAQMADNYLLPSYEPYIMTGEFHNGPLSVLIPFGIFGALAFIWFLIAGGRVIWRNYRRGDPELKQINTFLLTFYLARVIVFFSVFGALELDLAAFVGIVGLSIALNRTVRPKREASRLLRFDQPLSERSRQTRQLVSTEV
jgi:O-antigen ligase